MKNVHQAQVVQKLDGAIHRINHYPANTYYGKQLRYPLDSAIQRLNNRILADKLSKNHGKITEKHGI